MVASASRFQTTRRFPATRRRHQLITKAGRFGRRLALAALGILVLPVIAPVIPGEVPLAVSVAMAQDSEVQSLIDRVDRLQRELITLQRQVYRGEAPPADAVAAASLGGASDLAPTQAARIELRLSQFEAQLRALTGQMEESSYKIDRLTGRLDKLVSDIDLRLQRLEQAGPPVAAAQPGAGDGQVAAITTPDKTGFDTGPKTLGTIKESDLSSFQGTKVAPGAPVESAAPTPAAPADTTQTAGNATVLPGTTPQEKYNYAFGLLRQANYGEAESALRTFVKQHPTDPLAGNAQYWLGETYYVRGNYQQAAVTFAEAYQQYPNSSKAPDNLLKLGMSLGSLGSNADACGTYTELLKRYPDAATTVIQRAKQEQARLSCP